MPVAGIAGLFVVLVFFVNVSVAMAEPGYSFLIYYDDPEVVYRNGGTLKNIVKRADYIIKVVNLNMPADIARPRDLKAVKRISLDVRIRCDISFPNGKTLSYGFGKNQDYMQINKKVYPLDKALLTEVLKHLPLGHEAKLRNSFNLAE